MPGRTKFLSTSADGGILRGAPARTRLCCVSFVRVQLDPIAHGVAALAARRGLRTYQRAQNLRCVWRYRHHFRELEWKNSIFSRESGAENSKRIVPTLLSECGLGPAGPRARSQRPPAPPTQGAPGAAKVRQVGLGPLHAQLLRPGNLRPSPRSIASERQRAGTLKKECILQCSFGYIATILRELKWKMSIVSGRVVPKALHGMN
jgi:hypothetical protein